MRVNRRVAGLPRFRRAQRCVSDYDVAPVWIGLLPCATACASDPLEQIRSVDRVSMSAIVF